MKKLIALAVALAATASLAVPTIGGAAPAMQGGNGGTRKASAQDKKFLLEASQIDLYEIKGGEAATKKASASSVTKFGEDLARDHSSAYKEAEKVAKKVGATVAKAPNAKMKAELAKVGAKKGAAFDKAFTMAQIAGHKEAIAKARLELKKGSSTSVLVLTKKDLKMYEMHLKEAQSVMRESGSMMGGE